MDDISVENRKIMSKNEGTGKKRKGNGREKIRSSFFSPLDSENIEFERNRMGSAFLPIKSSNNQYVMERKTFSILQN